MARSVNFRPSKTFEHQQQHMMKAKLPLPRGHLQFKILPLCRGRAGLPCLLHRPLPPATPSHKQGHFLGPWGVSSGNRTMKKSSSASHAKQAPVSTWPSPRPIAGHKAAVAAPSCLAQQRWMLWRAHPRNVCVCYDTGALQQDRCFCGSLKELFSLTDSLLPSE